MLYNVRMNWNEIRNIEKGATGIVIANGPSLNDIPTTLLKKYKTIGANKIFKREDFVSSYYAVTNPLVISQNRSEIELYPSALKFTRDKSFSNNPEFTLYNAITHPRFSLDPNIGLHEGWTVTHICLQIAFWMGFSTILICGLDHYYHSTGEPNKTEIRTTPDIDHFTPDYFPPGTKWQLPDLVESEKSYRSALKVYQRYGRRIINISTISNCNIFPIQSYTKYL